MLKKFTPLVILAMFLVAGWFMIQGMDQATELAHPTKAQKV